MGEAALAARAALEHCAVPMRLGPREAPPGVVLRVLPDLRLSLLLARKGQIETLRAAAAAVGFTLPTTPRVALVGECAILWSGPEQWLVAAPQRASDAADRLVTRLAASCHVLDQSDARAVVSVSGPSARLCLAKGIGLDLHPRVFTPGDTALTMAAGIAVQLWQRDDAPTYAIAVPASMAESFWHWLTEAAAEFGCDVLASA